MAYEPRLNDNGVRESIYYNGVRSPFYPHAEGQLDWTMVGSQHGVPNIGNCTCYAWGRFWEIANFDSDKRPLLSTADANYWWSYNDGYERGQTPKLGAVLCLYGGNYSGWGHVAVVEQINPDGSILTSESGFHGYFWELRLRRPPDYVYSSYDGYTFKGFIYNPYADSETSNIKLWLLGLMKRRINNDNAKSRFTLAVRDREFIFI